MSGALLFPVFDQPFAGTIQIQTRAVDNQLQGPSMTARPLWQGHCLSAPAERAMIGNCKLDPQQMNDRTDQPFGLAQS
jgi:hypothetical protein